MVDKEIASLGRRNLLKAVLSGMPVFSTGLEAQNSIKGQMRVRDRFWMYGQEPGAQDGQYNLPGKSYITEAEATFYLSVPNLIFGFCTSKAPDSLAQDRQLAIPCRPFKQVVWSIVDCDKTDKHNTDMVLQLAAETPNITGVMMDDFFDVKDRIGVLSVGELQELQQRLKGSKKKLDLWVVLYDRNLDLPVRDHLALCDVITFWVWRAADLGQLPSAFAKLEKLAPQARKMLGCYMYDFGDKKPISISAMKFQCELALEWIHQGRIEGIVFDESDICDLGLEAVEWSRDWIRQVGDQNLAVKR
jgi:hypothetical protein